MNSKLAVGLALFVSVCLASVFVARRDHRIAAEAVAQERSRQADSVLRVVTPQLALVDTRVVHDTVKVRVAVERVRLIQDTLLHHLTDTLLVKEYVTRTDSAMHACTELSQDCAAFRDFATRKIAALETKIAAAPITSPPSRWGTALHWTKEIGKACAFISIGRGKPCWAR